MPRPAAAGVLGSLGFLLIGWTGLLVPTLIRQVKDAFGQTDAGIGAWYFVYSAAYASGSFIGGFATERLGRAFVLSSAVGILAVGLVILGNTDAWAVFLIGAIPIGFGGGALDGGGNGLFLDLYRTGRGRALNLLHLFFSIGAFGAPLVVGPLVDRGVAWQTILTATAVVAIPIGILFFRVPMPSGRHAPGERAEGSPRVTLAAPLVLLGVAIAAYVASEVGVSSWLVRFLEPAPLTTATTGLALLWAGLALGRLVSARLADRFDHRKFAIVSTFGMSVALAGAIAAAAVSTELSIGLFALAGFASGPVYPMIMAIAGDRYPDRLAAVSGFLSGTAVVGTLGYPPLMGLLSVTVGLTVAMAGNVILGLVCVAALWAIGRRR